MTIDALPGSAARTRREREALPIGESDANIIDCPACARPLAAGASRCPGCRTRLVAGVRATRAVAFMAVGLLAGLALGGGATAGAFLLVRASEVAVMTPIATTAPLATAAPVISAAPIAPALPSAAVSALRQSAQLNQRLATDAGRLAALLTVPAPSSVEIARILRAMTANATFGERIAPDLGAWNAGASLSDGLLEFYGAISGTARDGLAAALSNGGAYTHAAAEVLAIMHGLPELDARSRTLAGTVDLDLPTVTLPEPPTP
ncbi:MAG: hypothetical protein WEG56_13425 [Chloroflexota bacterium]